MKLDIEATRLTMAERCLCIADVGRKAGLANGTLYQIFQGKHKASVKTVGKIAKALGVSPEKLVIKN